jgi:hypothetical protein
MLMMLHYKAWKQIQDGNARTTPGKAVGFLFIPIFNFIWNFTTFKGLAEDMNRYAQRYGINMPPVPENIAQYYCLAVIGLVIPCLNGLAFPAVLVLYFMLITAIKNSSMAIAQHKQGGNPM